jgi:branched-chain amino acid transport system permease protein
LLRHGLEAPLVATFGLSIVLQALFVEAFSGNSRSLNASYATDGFNIGGTTVRTVFVIAFAIGVALVVLTHLGLTRTRQGRALRAASTDPDTAATMGVNVKHLYGVAFGIAAVIAAIGGVLIGVSFSMTPTAGLSYLIIGFAVVVLGGLGSIGGTLAGGIFIGLLQSVGADLLGGQYRDLIVFVMLVALLAIRPTGFFGRPVQA